MTDVRRLTRKVLNSASNSLGLCFRKIPTSRVELKAPSRRIRVDGCIERRTVGKEEIRKRKGKGREMINR